MSRNRGQQLNPVCTGMISAGPFLALWARCELQQLITAQLGCLRVRHAFTLWGQSGCWGCAPQHPSHLSDHEKMELPCLPLLLTPGWNNSWDHPVSVFTSVTKEKSSAAKIFNLELLIYKKKSIRSYIFYKRPI